MDYRVAIVDDNVADAEYVQRILNIWAGERQVGVHSEVFPTAEAFLFRYAEEKQWDILLLDIEMGAMDGVTMAKRVRQDNEAVQIVFITGYSDYIAEGYEVAALHYLMKPLNPEKLLTVLDRALDKRKQQERCLNLKYIRRVTKTEVHLSDGTVLPMPRGAYEPLNRAIIERT